MAGMHLLGPTPPDRAPSDHGRAGVYDRPHRFPPWMAIVVAGLAAVAALLALWWLT